MINAPLSDIDWLRGQFEALTDEVKFYPPSRWAEEKRRLPPSVTSMPGPFDFSVTPYFKEPLDCLGPDVPVRELDIMKGVQVGATVCIIENFVGYVMEHIKSAPCMFLTADQDLAKIRLDSNFIPMFQHSGLDHLIQSNDEKNRRKTGQTERRIEWAGGGFMIMFGAQNANKLRSISVQYLLEDEIDAYPEVAGKDGDPVRLVQDRTAGFEGSRKIARMSTPLIKGSSKIEREYKKGDQRKYHIPCRGCGELQVLRFKGENKDDGTRYGIIWEKTEEGNLAPGSVKYLCEFCGHAHTNEDKTWMFDPANGARWIATATAISPQRRSYHLSALYSPVGMQSWEACVLKWLDAWDEEHNKVRDVSALQSFYNNVLGEPFEIIGGKVRFEQVSGQRRQCYAYGQVPNEFAMQYAGSHILALVCTVDVHKDNLAVAVTGFTVNMRSFLVEYVRIKGTDCEDSSDPAWTELRKFFEDKEYEADDGRVYPVALTLIDAGYAPETVTTFCADYASGVYAIIGRDRPAKNQAIQEFAEYKTKAAGRGWRILVDHYKDRLGPMLRRDWIEESGTQEPYHFNAPIDATDAQLKELTVETRREKTDPAGAVSYFWHRPSGARNELWDLTVYAHAGMEIIAWMLCVDQWGYEGIEWGEVWDLLKSENLYHREP